MIAWQQFQLLIVDTIDSLFFLDTFGLRTLPDPQYYTVH